MKRCVIVVMSILLISAVACDPAKREQKELVRLQQKKATMLKELYADYGGSPLSGKIKHGIQKNKNGPSPETVKSAAQLVDNLDWFAFENHVLSLGGGERPFALSQKARDFFDRKDVRKKAVKIYEMDLRIHYLQQKLESRARTSGY